MHPIFTLKDGQIKNSGKFLKYLSQLKGEYEIRIEPVKLNRTLPQNNSIHLYCSQLAEALNDAGYTIQTFFKEGVDIPFSQITVKELIWKHFQKNILGKDHTAHLSTDEVDKIYKPLRQYLIESKGVDVPFPSIDSLLDTSESP